MPALTDLKIRTAKPEAKTYALQDGAGLYLEVRTTGAKIWRYRYWLTPKKDGRYTIGEYPDINLAAARAERDRVRELVRQGKNPTEERKLDRVRGQAQDAETLRAVATAWKSLNWEHWSDNYRRQIDTFLDRDLLAHLGDLPIREITSAQLLTQLRKVEDRGAKSIAKLIQQWTGAVFRHAILHGQAEHDPTYALRGAIRLPRPRHNPHLTATELPEFISALDAYKGYGHTRLALNLLLLTLVRTQELRLARWDEIDFATATWRIPAEKMKMREPHIVPLSRQAVAILTELREMGGRSPFVFPNIRNPDDGLTNTTLLAVIRRIGYAGQVTAHGMRGTASTILHEQGWNSDYIERQLAHLDRKGVRAAYNHATYLPQRREMLQWWADFIDQCRAK